MQFYMYDHVVVKNGVVDSDSGEDLSGKTGRISNIGYREDGWPFRVDIYKEDGHIAEYNFADYEIRLKEPNE